MRRNGTSEADHKKRPCERCVRAVRSELNSLGSSGDAQKVQGCKSSFASTADLHDGLLANLGAEVPVNARTR